ncbi:MAG: pyridoxine 5'-phosphate synthase [Elusimicrobiaceae bacterium]|nr:pyridoxine 5'-phosphate synthase [Elusimicrobiaceae bacterium]
MTLQLGVNIDHVATLRQARRATVPNPARAARVCLKAGADYIVIHLRRDERHINRKDVAQLCKKFPGKIHLECSVSPAMEKAALTYKPFSVCLVPEKPGEVTTTGGLKFTPVVIKRLEKLIKRLHQKKIIVSLFVSPVEADIRTAAQVGADIVELCTRDYSEATTAQAARKQLSLIKSASRTAARLGLEVHAGHGLDYQNVRAVAAVKEMACMNIGFSILAQSIFVGLPAAVRQMRELL